MASETVAGVDWAGGAWLAVVFDDDEPAARLERNLETLWNDGVDRILVDVPIGLPDDAETLAKREAVDSAARSAAERPSSVFPVPSRGACRAAMTGADYETVSERNRDDLDKGLSRQSYHIAPAVGEVDAFLREDERARDRILEAHPEVCFRGLNGSPLDRSKTTAPGVGERLDALDGHLDDPGAALGRICRELAGAPARVADAPNPTDVADAADPTVDDAVDALGLAAVASRPTDELRFLPAGSEYRDREGIPMRMAYWSPKPLD
jgi:predicted RNase H-like nuclease